MNKQLNTGNWTMLDENGATAVTFTSFMDLSYKNGGQTLSYPVEQGGFANYGKTQSPLEINLTLSTQGNDADFEQILLKLDGYRKNTVKLTVSTPSAMYENMTLGSYSYKKSRDDSVSILTVELELIEVCEVATQSLSTVITRPKNAGSSANVNTGQTQAKPAKI